MCDISPLHTPIKHFLCVVVVGGNAGNDSRMKSLITLHFSSNSCKSRFVLTLKIHTHCKCESSFRRILISHCCCHLVFLYYQYRLIVISDYVFLSFIDSDREDRESTSSSMSTANEKSTIGSAAFITSSLCSGTDVLLYGRDSKPF